MDSIYIISIAVGGVICALTFIFIIYSYEKRKMYRRRRMELQRAYADPSLEKMEYDVAFYDEEIEERISQMEAKANEQAMQQSSFSETYDSNTPAADAILTKLDDQDMEEICGTYDPDKK